MIGKNLEVVKAEVLFWDSAYRDCVTMKNLSGQPVFLLTFQFSSF
jgi:hypothetical protein